MLTIEKAWILALVSANSAVGFVPQTTSSNVNLRELVRATCKGTPSKQQLKMSYDDNSNNYNNSENRNFDLSKPTFDLFSLRTIRNDALLQYNALNQSEPLRINLYLILTLTLFSFPTISEAVIGEEATIPSIIGSIIAGVGSFALFLKECRSRVNQLQRIEKEMNAEYLQISLSTKNKLNPQLFGNNDARGTLKSLRGKKRIVAISGTVQELKNVMVQFRIFRRRLQQSNSIVVPIPTDIENYEEKKGSWWSLLDIKETEIRSCQWVGQANDMASWKEYFTNLVDDSSSSQTSPNELVWFGLNYNGRSFASGNGLQNSPLLLQILGQNLRPVDLLDETDENESINAANTDVDMNVVNEILTRQKDFYSALTEGKLDDMISIYLDNKADEVSEVSNNQPIPFLHS